MRWHLPVLFATAAAIFLIAGNLPLLATAKGIEDTTKKGTQAQVRDKEEGDSSGVENEGRPNSEGLERGGAGRGWELSQENAQSDTLSTVAESSDGRASHMVSGHQERGDGGRGGAGGAGGAGGGATITGPNLGAAGRDRSFGKPRGIGVSGSFAVVAEYKAEGGGRQKEKGLNRPQKQPPADKRGEAEARRRGGASSGREGQRIDDDNGNGEGGGEQKVWSRMGVMVNMVR